MQKFSPKTLNPALLFRGESCEMLTASFAVMARFITYLLLLSTLMTFYDGSCSSLPSIPLSHWQISGTRAPSQRKSRWRFGCQTVPAPSAEIYLWGDCSREQFRTCCVESGAIRALSAYFFYSFHFLFFFILFYWPGKAGALLRVV